MTRKLRNLTNEVRVVDTDIYLAPTYAALAWLNDRKLVNDKDWSIDMHGGRLGYTSFFFADHRLAVEFKIVFV
jgi:hypothetical protein